MFLHEEHADMQRCAHEHVFAFFADGKLLLHLTVLGRWCVCLWVCLVGWLGDWLVGWVVGWLVDGLIGWLVVCVLVCLLVYWFIFVFVFVFVPSANMSISSGCYSLLLYCTRGQRQRQRHAYQQNYSHLHMRVIYTHQQSWQHGTSRPGNVTVGWWMLFAGAVQAHLQPCALLRHSPCPRGFQAFTTEIEVHGVLWDCRLKHLNIEEK